MTPERWAQIESLYHQAHGRPSAERAVFLREACPDDESLRREVEHLLNQPGSDDGFLGRQRPALSDALRGAATRSALTGRSLGGYQVQAMIGVGGMGEVYRARDAKLGRDVAIKVLPAAFTADPGRLSRFEREARALAALNHPNVCAIYGFEESDGIRFLILELVEGETLADKLARLPARRRTEGGLSQREALNIARQIARALDVAHERGIVHRDLKPANIKITSGDVVKVLDFGLAKAAAGDSQDVRVGVAETATMSGTMDGAIIGTPAYMSPEQARGNAVDKRTDIWAFGCVLYEMLTGRATFGGDSVPETLASVLEREPDWSRLPADTPEPIRNLLVGCLTKDPRDRLRDIGDVRISIDSILSGSSGSRSVARDQPRRTRDTPWLPWALTAGLAASLLGFAIWTLGRPSSPPLTPAIDHRYSWDLPPTQQLDRSRGGHVLAISRDGARFAYVATPDRLYVRLMAELDATAVPGTEVHQGVREPAFSPNGQWIVFYASAQQALMRIPVGGGEAVKICEAETPFGISWPAEDTILFGQGRKGIWRVTPNGGASQVFSVDEGQEAHGPQLLPDDDHVLYTIASGDSRDRWDSAQIVVGSLTTKVTRPLRITGSDARYVAETRHLVYVVGNKLFAAPFDIDSLTPGTSGQVGIEGVSRAGGAYTGAANFSISDNGTLIYVPGAPLGPVALAFFRPDGTFEKQLALRPGRYVGPRAAPRGRRVAFTDDADNVIYTYDESQTGPPSRFASGRFPVWAANGTRIAFQAGGSIWWQMVDGDGPPIQLTSPGANEVHAPESWSESTQTLLYRVIQGSGEGTQSLWAMTLHNGTPPSRRRVGRAQSSEAMNGAFSPDGDWVAYVQTVRKETNLCVEPFPGPGKPDCLQPKPADSPKQPRWMRTAAGLRLFYNPRIGDFEVVSVSTRPTLRLGAPEPAPRPPGLPAMFQLAPPGQHTPYDITDDGRFLGLVTPDQRGYPAAIAKQIRVVTNWFNVPDGLRAKVPRSPVK